MTKPIRAPKPSGLIARRNRSRFLMTAPTSQGIRITIASSNATTVLSWLIRIDPPSATPRMTADAILGLRLNRTAASIVTGRKIVPMAMLTWYQFCQSSIDARPKKAPATMAPGSFSHSLAARYMA